MKFMQNTNRSISILCISYRMLIDLLVFCMNFIQNTNRLINILYQNKTGTQKRQKHNSFLISDSSCIYLRSPFANMFTPSSPFTLQTVILEGTDHLNDFQFLQRTSSSRSLKTEETFARCQQLNPALRPPSHTQSPATHFVATLFERAPCHPSNILKLHFVLFLVFWGVVSRNQAASSSAFLGLRKRDPSMLAITCG